MRVTLGRTVLRGQVDRIERGPDGQVRILDYKTGSSAPKKDDLPRHAQLGGYQVAFAEGAFTEHLDEARRAAGVETDQPAVSAGAALIHVGKAAGKSFRLDVQAPLDSDSEPRWAHDLVAVTGESMAGSTFAAVPEARRCERCPVRRTCPAHPEGAPLA